MTNDNNSESDTSAGGTERIKQWEVVLECVADDGSKYLYEDTVPAGPRAETPLEAVHWVIKRTAHSDETPCGIDVVRKSANRSVDTDIDQP